MKTIIVIPCFNEEEAILDVVNSIKHKYDYIVINDGSADGTEKALVENNINHIKLDNNIGIGGAVQTGYKYSYKKGYDIVIQFDGDGQHDAQFIETIVKPIKNEKANMVIGSRFLSLSDGFKSTPMRRAGIKILSMLQSLLTGEKIRDMTSGFRAIDRKILERFANNYPVEYPEPITNLELALSGYKIVEVQVKMRERETGVSSISRIKSAYYMLNVIFLFFVKTFSRGE